MQSDNKIEKHSEHTPEHKDRIDDLSRAHWLPQGLFRAIGPITLGVVVVGGIVGYYAYQYVTRDAVRLPFWVGFMFSFLAFVVLLVQSVIYAQQAEFMKDQSKAMRDSVERTDKMIENMQGQLTSMVHQEKAMQGQLEAMRGQVTVAVKQADLMAHQAEATAIAERAYLALTHMSVTSPIVDNKIVINVEMENGGRTPAREIERKIRTGLVKPPPKPFDGTGEINIPSESGLTFMAAGTKKRLSFYILNVTNDLFTEFEDGKRNIYIDGEVRFTDYMGKRHILVFGAVCTARDNGQFLERYQYQRESDPN